MKSLFASLFFLVLFAGCQSVQSQEETTKSELQQYTISVDGHPVSVWGKSAPGASQAILLVHGRTWSAVPDFDLQVEGEELSLMDGLVENGYATYAIDMRGYGNTPRDESGWLTPDRAAKDIAAVLAWINELNQWETPTHLFGWSMGSTMSQLTAQRNPELISSLTLFGYWKDSDQMFDPETDDNIPTPPMEKNTAEAAASDFITPGSISQNAIDTYVKMALQADPVRVDVRRYDQFNELDPAKVTIPTLILQGEFDPIGPTEVQSKLFTRLGTSHKQWTVVAGGDHAAFLETPRAYFIKVLHDFLQGLQ